METSFHSGASYSFSEINELKQSDKLTFFDHKAIEYFKNASREDLADFSLWWDDGENHIDSLIKGYFLPKSARDSNFSISQVGLQEIAKILAEKHPLLLVNILEFFNIEDQNVLVDLVTMCKSAELMEHIQIISEQDRAQIAKTLIREGNTKEVLKYFKYFSIENQKFIEEICDQLTETRPDLFIENIAIFPLNNTFVKDALIAKCLPHLEYFTSGKIREFVHAYLSAVSLQPPMDALALAAERIHLQSAEPSSLEKRIVDVFKKIADDPRMEILGRSLWSDSQEIPVESLDDSYASTQCGVTSDVLLKAIFGIKDIENMKQLDLTATAECVDNVIGMIKDNENKFEGVPPSHFFAYSIGSHDIDHAFVIIQYRNEDGSLKYKLLQSWVNEHRLNNYMERRTGSLSQKEFNSFSEDLRHLLLSPKWTTNNALFCKKYFMHDVENRVGKYKKTGGELTVVHGSSDLDKMKLLQLEFEVFKQTHLIKALSLPTF